jgi:hypothetical protein
MISHVSKFVISCDICKEHTLEVSNMSRIHSISEARRQGWVIGSNGDKCVCPSCRLEVEKNPAEAPVKEKKHRTPKVKPVTPEEPSITINDVAMGTSNKA